jgi:hypothetical protein
MKNIPESVKRRLLNRSRDTGEDFNQLFDRHFRERFLYRLSQSEFSNRWEKLIAKTNQNFSPSLIETIAEISKFVLPPLEAAATNRPLNFRWSTNKSWEEIIPNQNKPQIEP